VVITTHTHCWHCRDCGQYGRVESGTAFFSDQVHAGCKGAVDIWPLVSRSNDAMGVSTARCPLCGAAFPDPDWSGPGEVCPGCGVVWQHELRPTAESLSYAVERAVRLDREHWLRLARELGGHTGFDFVWRIAKSMPPIRAGGAAVSQPLVAQATGNVQRRTLAAPLAPATAPQG
jgi:hypothetical protein